MANSKSNAGNGKKSFGDFKWRETCGAVGLSCFENDGRSGPFNSYVLSRAFRRDGSDETEYTDNLRESDLGAALIVLLRTALSPMVQKAVTDALASPEVRAAVREALAPAASS